MSKMPGSSYRRGFYRFYSTLHIPRAKNNTFLTGTAEKSKF
jgi:hypothetical protein